MRAVARETRWTWHGRALWSAVVAGVVLMSAIVPAGALTPDACLAKKLKEWGKLRKCQATENGKVLQGKTADPATCLTKFDDKLAALNSKATTAGIKCRYGVNGDGTVTDYDTGLQWEQKTDDGSVHDKDNGYSWSATFSPSANGTAFGSFLAELNFSSSNDGIAFTACFAGHCDWRLPSLAELQTIVDCSQGTPCVDQTVFGPSIGQGYWSANSATISPASAWYLNMNDGSVSFTGKDDPLFIVRAVRSGL